MNENLLSILYFKKPKTSLGLSTFCGCDAELFLRLKLVFEFLSLYKLGKKQENPEPDRHWGEIINIRTRIFRKISTRAGCIYWPKHINVLSKISLISIPGTTGHVYIYRCIFTRKKYQNVKIKILVYQNINICKDLYIIFLSVL